MELDIEKIKELYYLQGYSLTEIGNIFQCYANLIRRFMVKHGCIVGSEINHRNKAKRYVDDIIKDYYGNKMPLLDISKKYNCGEEAIVRAIRSRGYNTSSRYTKEEIENMNDLYYNRNISSTEIGKLLGIGEDAVKRRLKHGVRSASAGHKVWRNRLTHIDKFMCKKFLQKGYRYNNIWMWKLDSNNYRYRFQLYSVCLDELYLDKVKIYHYINKMSVNQISKVLKCNALTIKRMLERNNCAIFYEKAGKRKYETK